jgi:hypothetical protein
MKKLIILIASALLLSCSLPDDVVSIAPPKSPTGIIVSLDSPSGVDDTIKPNGTALGVSVENGTATVVLRIGFPGPGQTVGSPTGADTGAVTVTGSLPSLLYSVDTSDITGFPGGTKTFDIAVSEPGCAAVTYTISITVRNQITYTVTQVGGAAGTVNSTAIRFDFSEDPVGLTWGNIDGIQLTLSTLDGSVLNTAITNPLIIPIDHAAAENISIKIVNHPKILNDPQSVPIYAINMITPPPPDTPVTKDLDITSKLPTPVSNPQVSTFNADQYIVESITWSHAVLGYGDSTYDRYTALITIYAKPGFALKNPHFTHANADPITYDTATGEITAVFKGPLIQTLDGTLVVSGTPKVGETLTAAFTPSPSVVPVGSPTYSWLKGSGTIIASGSSATYRLTSADAGIRIRASVTYSGQDGRIYSIETAEVQPADPPPPFTGKMSISISNDDPLDGTRPIIGGKAIIIDSSVNGTGTPTYRWERSSDRSTWTRMGFAETTYTFGKDDYGYYFKATVSYDNGSVSAATSTVGKAPLRGTLEIVNGGKELGGVNANGEIEPGDILKVNYSGNGTGAPTYTWELEPPTSTNHYIVKESDSFNTIRLQVSYADQAGYLSAVSTVVDTSYLRGDVALSAGSPTLVGGSIAAAVNSPNAVGLIYTWKADGNIINRPLDIHSRIYTAGVSDFRKNITVEVRSSNKSGSISSTYGVKVLDIIRGTPEFTAPLVQGKASPTWIIHNYNGAPGDDNHDYRKSQPSYLDIGQPVITYYVQRPGDSRFYSFIETMERENLDSGPVQHFKDAEIPVQAIEVSGDWRWKVFEHGTKVYFTVTAPMLIGSIQSPIYTVGGGPDPQWYDNHYTAVANGTAGTETSTSITLTFDRAVVGLNFYNFTLTNGTGVVVTGSLSGSLTKWTLALTSVSTEGDVTVKISNMDGIESGYKTVAVYKGPDAVTAKNLTSLVTAPGLGAAPDTTAIDEAQYTGTIDWKLDDGATAVTGNFEAGIAYKAIVTLAPKTGYTFTGVAADSFIHTGATTVTNAADSGTVTVTFPIL